MATRDFVPQNTGEGGIGTTLKKWATGFIKILTVDSIVIGTLSTQNPPVDADLFIFRASAAAWALVTATGTQIKAYLKTYFDTIYDTAGTAAGKIAHSISDGDTTHAPDSNSVFDALALKQAKSGDGLAITAGKTITCTQDTTLDDTVALSKKANLETANSFTNIAPMTTLAESWIGPSALDGIYFKGGFRGFGTTAPAATLHVRSSADNNIEFGETAGISHIVSLNDARSSYLPLQFTASGFNFNTGNLEIRSNTLPQLIIKYDAVPANYFAITSQGHFDVYGGNSYEWAIAGSQKMSLDVSGNINIVGTVTGLSFTSGTPNGGTAKPWKLGSLVTGQIGLVVLSTQYLEVDVNGVLIKLATI